MFLQSALEEIISPEDVARIGKTLFVLVDDMPPLHMHLVGNWKDRMKVIEIGDTPHDHNKLARGEWLWSTGNQSLCKYRAPKYNNESGKWVLAVILADGKTEKWAQIDRLRHTHTYRVCDVQP